MKYPPYSQMAAILILSEEENEAKTLSEKLAENIHSVCGDAVTLIGPSKAGIKPCQRQVPVCSICKEHGRRSNGLCQRNCRRSKPPCRKSKNMQCAV